MYTKINKLQILVINAFLLTSIAHAKSNLKEDSETKSNALQDPKFDNQNNTNALLDPKFDNQNNTNALKDPKFDNQKNTNALQDPKFDNQNNTNALQDPKFENQNNTIDLNKTKETIKQDTTNETCVGAVEYCNMPEDEYRQMLLEYIHPQLYEWVLICVHTVVFIIGLVGNALVCVAVYRNHTMRTVTNYFIVNLAVADFMVILFCLPPTVVWDVTETWFLGDTLCKILLYFQSVSVTVSVLTLTFISVNRWYAICFPLKWTWKSTGGRVKSAILVIWAVSLLFNIPELIVLTTVRTDPLRFNLPYLVQCMATWSPQSDLIWHIIKVLFIYTIPLMLMMVAYHQIVRVLWRPDKIPGQAETLKLASAEQRCTRLRSRRKAAKMLVAVVIMFAVCYFPVHLLSVLRYTLDMKQSDVITCLALVSHVLCYANSAINPLIYNFMSGTFRNEFRRYFCCPAAPTLETFTTLTRITSKRKQSDLQVHYKNGSTVIENGCKNGSLT